MGSGPTTSMIPTPDTPTAQEITMGMTIVEATTGTDITPATMDNTIVPKPTTDKTIDDNIVHADMTASHSPSLSVRIPLVTSGRQRSEGQVLMQAHVPKAAE